MSRGEKRKKEDTDDNMTINWYLQTRRSVGIAHSTYHFIQDIDYWPNSKFVWVKDKYIKKYCILATENQSVLRENPNQSIRIKILILSE